MTKLRMHSFAAGLLAIVGLAACAGTKTTIPMSWRNSGYENVVFDKLLVIGVGENEGSRRLFEDEFAKALAAQGATAQASWGFLPKSTLITEEEIAAVVSNGDFDAVLITRLLSVDEEQEYVQAQTYTVPTSRYGYAYGYGYGYGYYGYYGTSYAVVHQPGYFKTNTTFRIQTNLYAVSNPGLVWSGQSDTVNPNSVADVIDSMTAAVAKKLREEHLIP